MNLDAHAEPLAGQCPCTQAGCTGRLYHIVLATEPEWESDLVPPAWLPIIRAVAAEHRVDPAEVFTRSRRKVITRARQHMWAALQEAGQPVIEMAAVFEREASVVSYGIMRWRSQSGK